MLTSSFSQHQFGAILNVDSGIFWEFQRQCHPLEHIGTSQLLNSNNRQSIVIQTFFNYIYMQMQVNKTLRRMFAYKSGSITSFYNEFIDGLIFPINYSYIRLVNHPLYSH